MCVSVCVCACVHITVPLLSLFYAFVHYATHTDYSEDADAAGPVPKSITFSEGQACVIDKVYQGESLFFTGR